MPEKRRLKKPAELSGAEWTVIQAVWEREPCTAPAIHEALLPETRWTYSTVRTLMDRMVAKRFLVSAKKLNQTIYDAAVSRPEAQRSELLRALQRVFNGAVNPMVECLLDAGDASPEELARLEDWIRKKRLADKKKGTVKPTDTTRGKPLET
jgi:BlaI family penicillinase repressor